MHQNKLLILSYTFPPDQNGVSYASSLMGEAMKRLGWNVEVLTSYPLEAKYDPSLPRSVYFPVHSCSIQDWQDPAILKKHIKNIAPDIIVVHSWGNTQVIVNSSNELSIPVILVSHSYNKHLIHWRLKPPFFGLASWVKRLWEVRRDLSIFKKLSAFVSLSNTPSLSKNFDLWCARRLIPGRCHHIPNAINKPEKSSSFRQQYHIPNDSFVILNVANFCTRKNQIFGAKALKKLPIQNARFVFIGQERNDHASKVEAAVKNDPRFVFKYGLSRKDVENAIAESDLCYLCSESEMQPLFLLEAMSCKKPWLSTDTGVVNELKGGIIVPESAKKWRTCIMDLYNSPDLRTRLGEEGFDEWQTNYSKETVYSKWDQLLRNILESSS